MENIIIASFEEAYQMSKKQKGRKRSKWPVRFIIALIIFATGVIVGIHWKVLLAWIKGEEILPAPEGHCYHKRIYRGHPTDQGGYR